MALPAGWRDYKEGQDVPAGFVILHNVLVPIEQYKLLHTRKLLNLPLTSAGPQVPEIPSIIFQFLRSAEIGAFTLLRQENTTVVIHMCAVLQARVDLASNKDNMLKSDNMWLS
ncbi:hypothetical protein DSO57_1008220 [Entomophthora muscae]|uniref:Uncharacterized protein n=1 Tax=Entomophthora muscae TaxID=34485 RepID=A0ACC2SWC4_9FUNG|nr:hypothetical protein DSO57_1008220 [Entomophthora muscae]